MTASIAALTPTSHLLQAAVDQSFNAVVITSADHSGSGPCITYCNRAFAAMTGYSAEELLGQSPRILQGPLTDPKVIQHLPQCLQNGEFFQGSTFNYRKDGSAYLVEWNISPVRDASGQIQAYVSVQQDITARVRAEQRQALLAKALDATHDAVLIADHQAHILFVNHAFEQQTGYSSAEVLGRTPQFLQSGQHTPAFYNQLRAALQQGSSYRNTFTNRHKNGSLYYAAQTISPIKDEHGAISHYVSVSKDVTALVTHTRELRQQAYHDALTGLLNRRAGETQLQLCSQNAQMRQSHYALILCDIDNFKQVNDRFGHETGDHVLQRCASLLSASVRSGDTVVRWGGEEFLIILPDCPPSAALDLAERIRSTVASHDDPVIGGFTISLGVATSETIEDHTALLRKADSALYACKRNGRNQALIAA